MRANALWVYAGAIAVLAAARFLEPALAGSALVLGVALAGLGWKRRSGLVLAGAFVVAAASAATWIATTRVASMPFRWVDIAAEQETRAVAALNARIDTAVRDASAAAAAAAAAAGVPASGGSPVGDVALAALFRDLDAVRPHGVDALFLLAPTGDLVAWSGTHQGPLPEAARAPVSGPAFGEGPLFDYLYVGVPVAGGGRSVAAVLLEADPALGPRAPASIASQIASATGVRARFGAGPGPPGAAWRYGPDDARIVHAALEEESPAVWRAHTIARTRVLASALALLCLGIALALWLRAPLPATRAARIAPVLALALALAVAPVPGSGADAVFHPAMFLLPFGRGVTLWWAVVVGVPLAAIAAVVGGQRPRRGAAIGAAIATGLLLSFGVWALVASASDAALRSPAALWWGLQAIGTIVLGGLVAGVLPRPAAHDDAPDGPPSRRAGWWLGAGFGMAVALGAAVVFLRAPWAGPDARLAALWLAPAFAVAMAGRSMRRGGLARWVAGGVLAASALMPQLWLAGAAAGVRAAEAEVERLTADRDPLLDFLVRRFVEEARARFARGEAGPALLYRAWVASGLAVEGYPVRLSLVEPGGETAERLDVTASGTDPALGLEQIAAATDAARQGDTRIQLPSPAPGIREAAAAPIGEGWIVTTLALPRRSLAPQGLAATLLAARTPPGPTPTLTLSGSGGGAAAPGSIHWSESSAGVRGEGELRLPDGLAHAHIELDHDPPIVRFARGVLLLAADLAIMALLWMLGHALARTGRPPPAAWVPAPGSFRSRVTLALFLFFLAPALAFGAVAYRALAGTAERETASAVGRASAQAADILGPAGGDLAAVAALVGMDVLFYQGNELATSSRPELVELGVHDAWLPADAYLTLEGDEALAIDRDHRLLGRRAVSAYRRLPAGHVGVPALPGGAAATRRAELTDMLLFAALVGALLSLGLSLVAGRALARPIGQLSRAASSVGAGRFRVRLPADRRDEFGELFRSFNRMTRRLRRARARELQSARVLAWGEMARQVAHEIKNPLTPIRLSVQHLQRAYRDGREDYGDILDTNVEQVLHEIDRLSGIARAFARYGAPAESDRSIEAVDVAAVVRDVKALYASGDAGFAVRVSASGDARAAARDGELREVLINLLENARDALGDGGSVDVTVRGEVDAVYLEVADDGEGIPPDVLANVFEPHFSTRSSGTGLGLAIVKRLVEEWGGTVAVESEPGRGTTFRIELRPAT